MFLCSFGDRYCLCYVFLALNLRVVLNTVELRRSFRVWQSLLGTVIMAFGASRPLARLLSSAHYTFSKTAILPPPLPVPSSQHDALRKGKGLMAFLRQSLPEPKKREWLATWFSRRHPDRLLPGSVLTVTTEHAPGVFSGVLISVRRRGPDTSFVLRNVVQRTGVEMQFYVNSPHLKDIKIRQMAGERKATKQRRAKLFFLRDAPDKMTDISSGVGKS